MLWLDQMGSKDKIDMSTLQIRPRFKIQTRENPEWVLSRLEQALSKSEAAITGKVVSHHVVLNIPQKDQHYWSPQLHLEVEEDEEGSLIRGLFGPKPTVWTLFVFIYSVIGLFGLIALTFGLSKWMLGEITFWFWGIPGSLVAALVVYFIARTGQHLGREQMEVLKDFLEKNIDQGS